MSGENLDSNTSIGHKQAVQPRSNLISISSSQMNRLGLQIPATRLAFALRGLRSTDYSPNQPQVSNGILLFGHNRCGEDAVLKTVIKGCPKATQIYADFASMREESKDDLATLIGKVFRKAESCHQAIIVIARADQLFLDNEVTTAVLKEMQLLSQNTKSNVYIVAFVTHPRALQKNVLDGFQTRIPIPFPEGKAVVEIFKMFLASKITAGNIKVDDEDWRELCDSPSLKCVTWLELEEAACTAFTRACKRAFGKLDISKEDNESLVEILKGDVKAALDEIEVPIHRRSEEHGFKSFAEQGSATIYTTMHTVEIEEDPDDQDELKRKSRGNPCVWMFLCCFEGCF